MDVDHDLLMFSAVDETGRARSVIPSAILAGSCARSLVGPRRIATGALLEPRDVLDALNNYSPRSREDRMEYSAVLKLALVADAYGLLLRCGVGNTAAAWTPADEPDYWNEEVQTALGLVAIQLDCTVEQAAHRLFALDSTVSTSLIDTSRDVIAGRLCFFGNHDATTTEVNASREP